MSTPVPTQPLDGLMMRTPLLVRTIPDRAEQIFGEREVA